MSDYDIIKTIDENGVEHVKIVHKTAEKTDSKKESNEKIDSKKESKPKK